MPPLKSSLGPFRLCQQCLQHRPFRQQINNSTRHPPAFRLIAWAHPQSTSTKAAKANITTSTRSNTTLHATTKWNTNFFVSCAGNYQQGLGKHNQPQEPALTTETTGQVQSRADAKSPNSHVELSAAQRRQRRIAARQALAAKSSLPLTDPHMTEGAAMFPPDASAVLGAAAACAPAMSPKRTLSALLSLAKPRLTVLVVLTAVAPYALYPSPDYLSSLSEVMPSLSPLTLLFLTSGTALCSASANAFNMLYEPRTDAMMTRTRARPLVRALISTSAAVVFAVLCGVFGVAGLYIGTNPTVAFLGATNIMLYAAVYTPMKRMSALNTWIGAVVGAIPPLMGWAAAAGQSATGDGSWRELLFNFPSLLATTHGASPADSVSSSTGGWLLAALLYAWQFPHFMALSWPIRDEYRAAGLRMLCWVNPARNARVALRYSVVFLPLCAGLCFAGITEWSFVVTSLPVNVWLAWQAVGFWRHCGKLGSARGLFWASVWHLPAVMVLALVQKKGLWRRVWESMADSLGLGAAGQDYDDDDDDDYDSERDVVEWVYVDNQAAMSKKG